MKGGTSRRKRFSHAPGNRESRAARGVQLDIPDSVAQAIRLPEGGLREGLMTELPRALYERGLLGIAKC